MDMVLGVAVASALILFSVTLRAGIGATWVNRLGAKPWRPDAPSVTAATATDLMALTQRSLRVLRQVLSPQGFNLGINAGKIAGAGVADKGIRTVTGGHK